MIEEFFVHFSSINTNIKMIAVLDQNKFSDGTEEVLLRICVFHTYNYIESYCQETKLKIVGDVRCQNKNIVEIEYAIYFKKILTL